LEKPTILCELTQIATALSGSSKWHLVIQSHNVQFQKTPEPTPRKVTGNSQGREVPKGGVGGGMAIFWNNTMYKM